MSFTNLRLIEPVLTALRHEGYETPTPIQQQAIPAILDENDILGCAQTGTGKTAAFVIPILQLIHEQQTKKEFRPLSTLILSPTRELAIQIGESIQAYGRFMKVKSTVIYGGVSQHSQVHSIRQGTDILVATPGRLLDLLKQGHISLRHIRYFVLDEADRMLDMGFVDDVKRIIAQLPTRRQTLFFSATIPPRIQQLADSLLNNPVKVQVTPVSSTVEKVKQAVYFTEKQHKQSLLTHLLNTENMESVIVFTQMKHAADKIARHLNKSGIRADAIHGNKSQIQRQAALENFKNRKSRVLVATDIAARGIDVDNLSHVINFELPQTAETYVHRIGRTGRAGSEGTAMSFCDWTEKVALADIQKLIKKSIPIIEGHPFDLKSMHSVNLKETPRPLIHPRAQGMRKKQGRTFAQR